ncbi:MAG: Gfo/Idh/MocA family oxidoreductase [Deinococcota bacterium]
MDICSQLASPQQSRPIVIVGAGGIVKDAHLPAYAKAGFEVVAIYDLDAAKATTLAAQFGIPKVCTSLTDLIASAPRDAIFDVAVPAAATQGVLEQLPDHVTVLIQKPLGNDLAEAKKLQTLVEAKALTAAVNFQLRFAPFVLAAKSLIAQGVIGDLHDMEVRVCVYTPWQLWQFLETLPRMEILYHSIHYLDLMRDMLGEPNSVYAKTIKHPNTPKLASSRSSIILDYGDTIRSVISTNHGHNFGLKHQESFIKWEGTKGAIKATMGLLMNYPQGEADSFEYCTLAEGQPLQCPQWQSLALEGTWFPDAFIGSMTSLMHFAEGSSPTLPTATHDALKTMQLVEAAHISNDEGGVRIDL